MNMAISGGIGMGLGNYQVIVNIVLLIAQLIWGRSYIGFGSIVNMFFLGYIIQFSGYAINGLFGDSAQYPLPFFATRMIGDCCCVLVIVAAVFGGLITWQTSHLGVGTIAGAFCLGPLINFFNKYNRKWIVK